MRALHVVCSFVLSLLVEGTAIAQIGEPASVPTPADKWLIPGGGPGSQKKPAGKSAEPGKSAEQVQDVKKRSAEWFKTCLEDWDAQTHMSKAEWRTTCGRVSREREQFYLNTPGALSIGERALR